MKLNEHTQIQCKPRGTAYRQGHSLFNSRHQTQEGTKMETIFFLLIFFITMELLNFWFHNNCVILGLPLPAFCVVTY